MSPENAQRDLTHSRRVLTEVLAEPIHAVAYPVGYPLQGAYRDAVIPPTVKARVSVEAGVSQGWREVVGDHGRVVGIDQYGASADYQRIYTEYGLTATAVADAARDSLRTVTG